MNTVVFEDTTGLYHLWVGSLFASVITLCLLLVRMTWSYCRLRIELDLLQEKTDEEIRIAIEQIYLRRFQSVFLTLISWVAATIVLTFLLMTLAPRTTMVVGPILATLLLSLLWADTRLKRIKEEWRETSRVFCQARRAVNRRQ